MHRRRPTPVQHATAPRDPSPRLPVLRPSTLALVALGVPTLLLALRMVVFAARLSATDDRVRLLLQATEPIVHPFRLFVDATAAQGTIEVASVAAGFLLLIGWAFALARIDRETAPSAGRDDPAPSRRDRS